MSTSTPHPYPAYKPSAVPWLGDIPEHWDVRRVKFFYREVDERSANGSEELMSVSHKTGVTPRKRNVTMFLAESNVGYKVCRPGDIVVNTMWAYMAALGVARQEGLVSPSYGVYRPLHRKRLNPDYIDPLLRTEEYRTAYLARSTGITDSRLRLYPESFLGIHLLCPPLPEQAAIVRYLDHADRRIRAYVSAKQKLIGLLEEEKQAVINQAVTRGLDPNVRLKPSGVEWLGDVPEHWDVRRLKGAATIIAGQSPPSAVVFDYSGNFPFLQGNAEFGYTSPIARLACASAPKWAKDGDILMSVRAPVGALNVADQDYGIGRGLCAIRPMADIEPQFTYNTLTVAKQYLYRASTGSTYDAVTIGIVGGMHIPLPPLSEQTAIAAHLDKATAGIDAAIARARRQIELLGEYRTRLIADVVTGKLDVREAENTT